MNIIDKLIEKYDIDEATAKADFDAFLQNVRNAESVRVNFVI